jgi:hypothetical protein
MEHHVRWTPRRASTRLALIAATAAAACIAVPLVTAATATKPPGTSFSLFPQTKFLPCLAPVGQTPTVHVDVVRGTRNDTLTISLANFKPKLGFDLFTVENSPQNADGTPNSSFTTFGLAWYQSDIKVGTTGTAKVTIKTILLDQIFGFDAGTGLAPVNTFHVGFWFDNPTKAASCGFTGVTPFNGEHTAGPLAFVSRPDAVTHLGPLCTDPNSTPPPACNP